MKREFRSYEDIIDLPHHDSKVHPRMARIDRAAQFAPFAALSGHGEEIKEAARFTVNQIKLSEDMKKELDDTLEELIQCLDCQPQVEITYYERDKQKQGGKYKRVKGYVEKVNLDKRSLYLNDGFIIELDKIFKITIQNRNVRE